MSRPATDCIGKLPPEAEVWVPKRAAGKSRRIHTHPGCRSVKGHDMRSMPLEQAEQRYPLGDFEECGNCIKAWEKTKYRTDEYVRAHNYCINCGETWLTDDALGDFGVFTDCPECDGRLSVSHKTWRWRVE